MATISPTYLVPPVPEGLEGISELALDLRWSWSHMADAVWESVDPQLWKLTRNPWLILQTVARTRLETLAGDPSFRRLLGERLAEHRKALEEPAWFLRAYPQEPLTVAYFSMEFGLSEALPIYSGGLGILAGDHLKTSSDLGVPLVGVGLLYQQGYFRQAIDAEGNQIEFYPYNDPSQLPVVPVRSWNGEWLRIALDYPGRQVILRAWEAKVGRVKLYLLDSNDPVNGPADQGITSELYGGGLELRLQQEIALGIGGWRLLRALGIQPDVCHINEGHPALAVLERACLFMQDRGHAFPAALAATRAGNVFTTHTPVDAGFDCFPPPLVGQYLSTYAERLGIGVDGLLRLGRRNASDKDEPLNMAYLAIRCSGVVNGVSRLHGEVSRGIFQALFPRWPRREVPVTHVTNGIHVSSWDSAAADALWTTGCGKERWLGTMSTIEEGCRRLSDETLWDFRNQGRAQLVRYVKDRLKRQLETIGASEERLCSACQALDRNIVTIGFARRFASYKRPTLLLFDPERLIRILNHPRRPAQLIIAGKAHPHDSTGKSLIAAWLAFSRRPEVHGRVVFLADYDMVLAEQMVQGVDLWINTPRRPWEACGTSGMKVLVNGGLNLSELDGWWAEAYDIDRNVGWALGDGREHGDDPDWDAREAERLYRLLEEEVIPCFYERDEQGIPRAWVARMRRSMTQLTPRFSSNRMVRECVEALYLPAAQAYRERSLGKAEKAVLLCQWLTSLEAHWQRLRFGDVAVDRGPEHHAFKVAVHLEGLDPTAVKVQLYADPENGDAPEIIDMERTRGPSGAATGHLYEARVPLRRPASDYTPRIVPAFPGAAVPIEAPWILWYR